MVWAAFSVFGKTPIVILDGHQTSRSYISTLEEHLVPFIEQNSEVDHIFQQDNCSIHTAAATKRWFEAQNITVMDWPSRSPDLNPMENLWGILVQKVYQNGQQFENRASLVQTIKKCWNEITDEIQESLINSMKSRCLKVLMKNGDFLKY